MRKGKEKGEMGKGERKGGRDRRRVKEKGKGTVKGGGKGERRKEKGERERDRGQEFSSGNHNCGLRHR